MIATKTLRTIRRMLPSFDLSWCIEGVTRTVDYATLAAQYRPGGILVAKSKAEGELLHARKTRVDRAPQGRPPLRPPRRAGPLLGSRRRRPLFDAGPQTSGEERLEAGI